MPDIIVYYRGVLTGVGLSILTIVNAANSVEVCASLLYCVRPVFCLCYQY